ncbi:MAG: hypothetical protein K0R38_5463 [Polyangiaceae bacterium]|jgi:hypothetical protein|nr:hypothetical protein [Polyangiaceae bacterium]
MSTGLERRAHRLVELSRAGDDPSATQLLSLHGAVTARIAAQGASATAGATAKVSHAGALLKGLVAAGAIATASASFFALGREEPKPVLTVSRALPAETSAPSSLTPEPAAPAAPEPAVSATTPATPRPAKVPASLRLREEAALLAEVQSALRSGQPKVALGKLDSYDRRFPGGVLRAEADAAKVFALCSSGRVERARASAQRFVKRYPGSPAIARVQAACK